MATAKLKLSINEFGLGTAFLNDVDISGFTSGIEFTSNSGEVTKVKLTIMAEVDAEIVAQLDQIALAKNEPVRPEAVRFLKARSRI